MPGQLVRHFIVTPTNVLDTKELTVEELTAQLTAKDTELIQLKNDLADADEIIEDLKEQLDAAKKGQSVATVSLGNDTYQVLSPDGFRWKGKIVTHKDLQDSEELVKALVDAGAGVLVKLEKPAKAKKTR